MNQRLVVSTECPTCSAPLDFAAGSNVVRCQHCRSNLLVTGRKQVLSYYIAPKIDGRHAATHVMFAHREAGQRGRVVKAQLYFVPYYRLTGHDLRWERPESAETAEEPPRAERWGASWALKLAALDLLRVDESLDFSSRQLDEKERRIELRDRYVEKSLIACQLGTAGLFSLGLRPTVLRLRLFRREAAGSESRIVAAEMSPETALSEGMKAVCPQPTLYRKVIGRVLSIIYQPYWMVEVDRERRTVLSIVDAVTDDMINLDCPVSLYQVLDREPSSEPQVAEFRPLVCPNCGWDVAAQPEDAVLCCSSCRGAWQIHGSDLKPVPYQVAAVPSEGAPGTVKYQPFWVLEARHGQAEPLRFFLPAFRYRRLKFLVDLARALSKKAPSYALNQNEVPLERGCFYDDDDALGLAEFVYAGLDAVPDERIRTLEEHGLAFGSPTLTWFPYRVRGDTLIDPFTGRAFYESMLA